MGADDLTSALEEIKRRERKTTKGPWQRQGRSQLVETAEVRPDGFRCVIASLYMTVGKAEREAANADFIAHAREDIPRLVAALEAVLKLHQPGRAVILGALCERHENHRHFSITRTEQADIGACPDCAATVYASCTGCGPGVNVDACVTRLAITREITGKGAGDGKP